MWHSDLLPYFDKPVETEIQASGAMSTQIAAADPDRVVLIIGTPGATALQLSINPNAAAGQGMRVDTSQQPLIITQAKHGSLCQVAWYSTPDFALGTITVIELFLRRRPPRIATDALSQEGIRSTQRNGSRRGNGRPPDWKQPPPSPSGY